MDIDGISFGMQHADRRRRHRRRFDRRQAADLCPAADDAAHQMHGRRCTDAEKRVKIPVKGKIKGRGGFLRVKEKCHFSLFRKEKRHFQVWSR